MMKNKLTIHYYLVFSVPFCWSVEDKGDLIAIQSPSQLKFIGTERKENLIRTTNPISLTASSFYFEAKIVSNGKEGIIAIGLTQCNPNTKSGHFPGWNSDPSLGIGYHGDEDGGIDVLGLKILIETDAKYIFDKIQDQYRTQSSLTSDDILQSDIFKLNTKPDTKKRQKTKTKISDQYQATQKCDQFSEPLMF